MMACLCLMGSAAAEAHAYITDPLIMYIIHECLSCVPAACTCSCSCLQCILLLQEIMASSGASSSSKRER